MVESGTIISECRWGGCGQPIQGASSFTITVAIFGEPVAVQVYVPTCAEHDAMIGVASRSGALAVVP